MLRARKASPGRKFLWIAHLSTRFPRFDECILHHVFGFVAVLQRTKRNGKKWTTHFSFWSRKTDASFRIVQTRECNPLHSEHHIVNCSVVRPRFAAANESSTHSIIRDILPFLGVALSRT